MDMTFFRVRYITGDSRQQSITCGACAYAAFKISQQQPKRARRREEKIIIGTYTPTTRVYFPRLL